jgi:hypothetical protein
VKLAGIVEGHGEVQAFRVLVERVCAELRIAPLPEILPPIRVKRNHVVKPGELERHVELLANRVGVDGAILVLLDADDDCAATFGPDLLQRASAARPDRRVGVVFAVREFEAWLLASVGTLRGQRGIPGDVAEVHDPEKLSSPKARMDAMMPGGYLETVDQPALTARIDVAVARAGAPSFDKLVRELQRLLPAPTVPGSE